MEDRIKKAPIFDMNIAIPQTPDRIRKSSLQLEKERERKRSSAFIQQTIILGTLWLQQMMLAEE